MAEKKPTIKQLKEEYLRYFAEFPVQRAAADWIGRDEDTIIRWREEDKPFAEAVKRAKSEWAKKASKKVKPDNLLINMYPDDLKPPKQESDVNVIGNVSITYVRPDHNLPADDQTGSGVAVPDQPDND